MIISSPEELRQLPEKELAATAEELRKKIIESVSRNGGHLASSCGCVELIVALHRIFNTPAEKIFFDVGHQAYAHKLLTGRAEGFEKLRRCDGVSGFPAPAESEFDPAVAGHAGCALSAALGCCAADPDSPEKVIAVIGDGAMGCGVTFEALNHAGSLDCSRRLIVILNDNRMSISGNVGALSRALNRVIAGYSYNRLRRGIKKLLSHLPRVKNFFSRLDEAGKSVFLPPALLFETLGFRYFGAVNGNDLDELLPMLRRLKEIDGPVLLHVITKKGYGCSYAEASPTLYHGIGGCNPDTGELSGGEGGFSAAFGAAMERIAGENKEVVAISPAMLPGTGLSRFQERFPDRCFDTGIAEEHALTFAAGLAAAGKRPVCAFYDTFLQRALDEIYHDAALANLPLIITADRAGAVADGPTHHGIYNCGFLRAIPNLTVLTLAGENEVYPALKFALELSSPVVIRYPKGKGMPDGDPAPFVTGKGVILQEGANDAPVLWSLGQECVTALKAAEELAKSGLDCTVINARFLRPFDRELVKKYAARRHFSLEDHSLSGGLYSALAEELAGVEHGGLHGFGWDPDKVVGHGDVGALKAASGLDAAAVAEKIAGIVKFF